MQRVGIFSGKLYSQEDYNNKRIKECAVCVTPSTSNQDEEIKKAKDYALAKRITNCYNCKACEESIRI